MKTPVSTSSAAFCLVSSLKGSRVGSFGSLGVVEPEKRTTQAEPVRSSQSSPLVRTKDLPGSPLTIRILVSIERRDVVITEIFGPEPPEVGDEFTLGPDGEASKLPPFTVLAVEQDEANPTLWYAEPGYDAQDAFDWAQDHPEAWARLQDLCRQVHGGNP